MAQEFDFSEFESRKRKLIRRGRQWMAVWYFFMLVCLAFYLLVKI